MTEELAIVGTMRSISKLGWTQDAEQRYSSEMFWSSNERDGYSGNPVCLLGGIKLGVADSGIDHVGKAEFHIAMKARRRLERKVRGIIREIIYELTGKRYSIPQYNDKPGRTKSEIIKVLKLARNKVRVGV